MGAYKHPGAFTPGAHEAALGVEFQHRVVAAIQRDDIALGTDRDAAHTSHDRVGGIMEKVFHQMEWQLRYRRRACACACACATFLRAYRRYRAKRNRRDTDR